MRNLYSLFLSQAYKDWWDDYNRSLKLRNFPKWDYVILTASNEQQAEGFRKQIEERRDFLPKETTFVAIPDRDGKRVGSGGATLEVLKYLHEQEESFDGLRILVIHSGGDSKRVPQYSSLGKLFSPVPHVLPNGRNSTLFDEFMICMSSVPSRIREGMVLLSGDVLLLFNPLQIDYNNVGAAAISFKEHVETGKNHGVYLNGENGNVKCCLQKKSVEVLREVGAVNESDCVDIDTGALIFSTDMMKSLYSLKENKLFGTDLDKIEKNLGVKMWEDDSHTLWSAALYPEKDTIEEAVGAALNLYAIVNGNTGADLTAWKEAPKKSLCSGFNDADPDAIIAWNKRMADLVAMDEIAKAIRNKVPAGKLRKLSSLTKIQKEWLERRIDKADFSEKMRLHYYLGVILNDEDEVQECFRTIQSEVLASTIKNLSYNENARIVTDKHTVKLPLRVNWGGGWSDTPPYCNENGGTVLNLAILLNGQKPVEVTLEKINEKKIVFDSRDMDVHGEFDSIEPLQATGDPFDPFALQKACLLACGIIPKEGSSLEEVLDRLGGGFEMHSEVTNVPKGSGLGTSSILSAACVKAVFEFMGIEYTEEDLYAHVLAMEQIMSTGGGWQDQVGGITPGLKYITSMPGIDQQLKVTHVEIPEEAKKELDDRFVLIYTGQRRLARNLLRDVVGRYVGNEPDSLFALEEIQKTAALMRFELERGNIDGFASLLDYHWELSKKVDAGSSNTLIEQIFSSIEELIDGKLVCGAGGGGFLQVILKKGITRQQVEDRLNEVFMDSLVGVADCKLVWE